MYYELGTIKEEVVVVYFVALFLHLLEKNYKTFRQSKNDFLRPRYVQGRRDNI
jgi:hypothetical protein